jgi:FkbM family methyltransferase
MKALIKRIIPRQLINLGLEVITFFAIKIYKPKYPNLIIRKDTSDIYVFMSIFVLGEFKLPLKINPKLIIDAGAYTGLSALYYSSKYPSAKIIAIEPETSNFKILEKNTKHLPNIKRIKGGLWDKNAFLKIRDRGTGKWGFAVEEVSELEDFDVKAVTIEKILKESEFDKIDILKLDIEGSEKQLFSKNYQSWLKKVNIIVIELHDRIINGCTESLYSAINKNEWKEYKEGEKVIFIRKKLL